ncbi:nucleotidyltransferase family protein [Maribacter confluentis]|uniref:Nucleotidyltransferase family protein n=1 Tax=Maribacter confluentis TaxID=1656093 RepID=A0ABT8RVQ9_9FLAO|nr:nucleotidyltransferase family protein [Maribacter confluentis]MDO1514753.1 nucleotidyltransferase family protein [Maribacter confluentis]
MISGKDITVLIMAAGESKRMQDIKQLLPWKDSNFLLEIIKTAKNSRVGSVHLVLGAHAARIVDKCSLNDLHVDYMINPNWQMGLGNSIAYGINHLLSLASRPQGILICLADQPLMTSDYLNLMVENFIQNPNRIIATNYTQKTGVPALFPITFYEKLSQLKDDYGAKEILKRYRKETIGLNAGKGIIDIDTKAAYEQLITDTQ